MSDGAGVTVTVRVTTATGSELQPDVMPGGMQLHHASPAPPLRFDRQSFTVSWSTGETPAGAPLFGQLKSGHLACASDGSERPYRRRDVFLAIQPEHPHLARAIDSQGEVALIDLGLLSQLTATAGWTRQPVRFSGPEPVSPQAAQTWKATYAYIRDTVLASPATRTPSMIVSSAGRLLAAATLVTFPNTTITSPAVTGGPDVHSDTLRRAITYIDENARDNTTVADIAAAAAVTVRAVQLAFRRQLGTTPMAYLRQVRLGHAHQDLQNGGPGATITSVAYRWGFPSPSRFATYYQQAYGITPSHTLHQK